MSKTKATKFPDLNKNIPKPTNTKNLSQMVKDITSVQDFYEVCDELFARTQRDTTKHTQLSSSQRVFIGDVYLHLAKAAELYVWTNAVLGPVFQTTTLQFVMKHKDMASNIIKDGATFLKIEKKGMILMMFITS